MWIFNLKKSGGWSVVHGKGNYYHHTPRHAEKFHITNTGITAHVAWYTQGVEIGFKNLGL